jgi:hypothetical protein
MGKKTIDLRMRVILALLAWWLGVAAFPVYADTSDWIWETAAKLTQARSAHSALLVELPEDGRCVMVIGGMTNEKIPKPLPSTELYCPGRTSWMPGPLLKTARAFNTATLLTFPGPDQGKVLVAGGYHAIEALKTESIADCELLNPKGGNVPTKGDLNDARDLHVAIELIGGRVLVAGGENHDNGTLTILDSSELYDPTERTWVRTKGSLNHRRLSSTAVLFKEGKLHGKVLVVGGFDMVETPGTLLPTFPAVATCELYDPVNDRWDNATSLNQPRVGHSLTLLHDGRVLAAGGSTVFGGAPFYRSYEIYDPETGKWTCPTDEDARKGKHLRQYRAGHAAVLLEDKTVLLVSGYTSEIYDSDNDTWTFTEDTLHFPRTGHTATLLKDKEGRVLVAGGVPNEAVLFQPPSASSKGRVDPPVYRAIREGVKR